MSEYKTLDEYFPDGKPDGRCFRELESTVVFKPFFRTDDGYWHGLTDRNLAWSPYINCKYKEYIPPKQTKKVKMYKPVFKDTTGHYCANSHYEWDSLKPNTLKHVVGYLEIEVEVEE